MELLAPMKLEPITRKAKNRVSDVKAKHPRWDGLHWRPLARPVTGFVLFSDKPGPWVLVQPAIVGLDPDSFSRWVNCVDDADFRFPSGTPIMRNGLPADPELFGVVTVQSRTL